MPMTEQQLAAAKADKYIGRDGGKPRLVSRSDDVATIARALTAAAPSVRGEALFALARVSGMPVGALRRMMDDCPF